MTGEKFVFKIKRDSIPEPEDFSLRRISCFDFFASVNSFIEHNFTGAIKMEFPDSYKGFVHISPRGFAYFVSLLLSEIYGNAMVNASITNAEGEIVITVATNANLKQKDRLIDIAERSGFSVTDDKKRLILKTPVKINQEAFVYAGDVLELRNYFYEVFLA